MVRSSGKQSCDVPNLNQKHYVFPLTSSVIGLAYYVLDPWNRILRLSRALATSFPALPHPGTIECELPLPSPLTQITTGARCVTIAFLPASRSSNSPGLLDP
ncbi:unnamed protein product [Nezara viridula]|uniref:Uncharacterized protein n=1 Tax=Nezara viridula TaxID=85310 RepID=A0A9P0HML0_NEZVI|nr:unnamed protein product [Nezara viridula]